MGLLDDAIREHLDLKRRRGADPVEVARQEQEALGPPRTGQFAAAPDDEGAEDDIGPAVHDEPGFEEAEDPAAAVAVEGYEEPELPDEEPWLDDAPPRATVPLIDHSTADQSTREFEPPQEEDPEPPAEEGSEDVLEETPDFLQETPEHDRLWFEQRPPRDFDFDK